MSKLFSRCYPLIGKGCKPWRFAKRSVSSLMLVVLTALPASAQVSLSGSVIAGGGGHGESAGGCLVLAGTLGEPTAGATSGGVFALTSGYWAQIDPSGRDKLFHDGFEECQ